MTPPSSWRGADGTVYRFVAAPQVRFDQPRWWVDEIPEHGDRTCGPATPDRLHLLPMKVCMPVGQSAPWALVAKD